MDRQRLVKVSEVGQTGQGPMLDGCKGGGVQPTNQPEPWPSLLASSWLVVGCSGAHRLGQLVGWCDEAFNLAQLYQKKNSDVTLSHVK